MPIDEFGATVDTTLGDQRSWIAGKNVRLQRVATAVGVSFTVFLVTPGTAQRLCSAGGSDIFWRGEPYTSCRVGAKVIINLSRYLKGVPHDGAPLDVYRQYAINHEVGHALGHGHELCLGKGIPAPVMQQQTFDLLGCVAAPSSTRSSTATGIKPSPPTPNTVAARSRSWGSSPRPRTRRGPHPLRQ